MSKIIAERSESAVNKTTIIYDEVDVIREELQHADGWESQFDSDDVVKRTFWGYAVELKDVTLKKLAPK